MFGIAHGKHSHLIKVSILLGIGALLLILLSALSKTAQGAPAQAVSPAKSTTPQASTGALAVPSASNPVSAPATSSQESPGSQPSSPSLDQRGVVAKPDPGTTPSTTTTTQLPAIPPDAGAGTPAPRENPVAEPDTGPKDPAIAEMERQLAERQAEAARIQKRQDELTDELEIITEDFNKVRAEYDGTKADLAQTRLRLQQAIAAFQTRQVIFDNRISHIYKWGDVNFLEVLLNTKDFSDFLVRVSFLVRVGQQDMTLVEHLLEEKSAVEQEERRLGSLQEQQLRLERELQQRQIEIGEKIAELGALLNSLEDDILAILDTEAQYRAAEQGTMVERLREEAAQPGSPLATMLDPASVIFTTLQYMGIPYLWGGARPETGFDCSGLVQYVFVQHGVSVPHYSGWQFQMGTWVTRDELQPGDLVFFGNPVHHVGIFMGGDYYIHAPKTGDVVKISRLSDRNDWAGARRFPLERKRILKEWASPAL